MNKTNKTNKTLIKEKQQYFKWLNKNGYSSSIYSLAWYYNRKKQIEHNNLNNSYLITIKSQKFDINNLLILFTD